jgi:exosome complex exonuclease RRP6
MLSLVLSTPPCPVTPPLPRSYQGFTCLLQLSTRDADWVVDTLALRGQLGPALAPLMTNPDVEKVLHGSDNDIQWLQVG